MSNKNHQNTSDISEQDMLMKAFQNDFLKIIVNNCEGIYLVNHSTDSFQAIKCTPFLDSLLGQKGSYQEMCQMLIFSKANSSHFINRAYMPFIENGIKEAKLYSRRIHIDKMGRSITANFIYFPSGDPDKAYVTISTSSVLVSDEQMQQLHEDVLKETYLYSMIVDLDENICTNCYTSQVNFSGQDRVEISFYNWRDIIKKSFSDKDQLFFLQQTDPVKIRCQLDRDNRFAFNIRMHDLKDQYIWTRHSILKIRDIKNSHLMFVYTVQDIDKEVKCIEQYMISLKNNEEQLPEEAAPEPQKGLLVSGVILDQVEQDIRTHFAEKITLKTLSDKYYINSAYLGQLFFKKYRISFNEFLARQRIENAAYLLGHTDLPIHDIIEKVGYSSTHYFNRKFREIYKCTPGRYRRLEKAMKQ